MLYIGDLIRQIRYMKMIRYNQWDPVLILGVRTAKCKENSENKQRGPEDFGRK